eukprot:CAMPEP_0197443208 /NCGR_PEP_ID=MMETSP1175-20131217/9008_1 /TAXON_ID=1003142 /ORGANISM="Triceratium dubium, Strain CCMP147" /LENGTH=576 /DNA_ID=CAMNT_0042973805 /DNA_START=57 /DNA_END=1787 /DNA_ORIENTATION=+
MSLSKYSQLLPATLVLEAPTTAPYLALRLLAAAYHNLGAAIHATAAMTLDPSSQHEKAVEVYRQSLRARMKSITCRQASTTTSVGVSKVMSEIETVLRQARQLEGELKDHEDASSCTGGLNNLDMYPQAVSNNMVHPAQVRDVRGILPRKAPTKIDVDSYCDILLEQRCHDVEADDKKEDEINALESTKTLYNMALCCLEMADNGNDDVDGPDESSNALHLEKARELLKMASDVVPLVRSPPEGNAVADDQHTVGTIVVNGRSVRVLNLAADIYHALALVEYRAESFSLAMERLTESLRIRTQAADANNNNNSHRDGTRSATCTDDEDGRTLKFETERGTADSASLLGRVHYVVGNSRSALRCVRKALDIRSGLYESDSLQVLAARYNAGLVVRSAMNASVVPLRSLDEMLEAEASIARFASHPRLALASSQHHRWALVRAEANFALSDALLRRGHRSLALGALRTGIEAAASTRRRLELGPSLPAYYSDMMGQYLHVEELLTTMQQSSAVEETTGRRATAPSIAAAGWSGSDDNQNLSSHPFNEHLYEESLQEEDQDCYFLRFLGVMFFPHAAAA